MGNGKKSRQKLKKKKVNYQYTECGLDNVTIMGAEVRTLKDDTEIVCLPDINDLHLAIAYSIIIQEHGVSGKEIRFLRTEMGLTQDELAERLKVTRKTVSTWETGSSPMDSNAEFVLRTLAAEKVGIDPQISAEEMAQSCVWRAAPSIIAVSGKNPGKNVPRAA